MRTRIRTENFLLEYEGPPQVWNEFLRPVLGGPEAPAEPPPRPEAPSQPVRASAPVRIDAPPRPSPFAARAPAPMRVHDTPLPEPAPSAWDRRAPARSPTPRTAPVPSVSAEDHAGGRRRRLAPIEPIARHERTSDPSVLYPRLASLEGRRGEKDTVLAAVWFVAKEQGGDAAPEEVERHLLQHNAATGIKVRPMLQKHVSRTRMCEPGGRPGSVRLSPKGEKYVRQRLLDA